jgi:hypothetical protein
MRNGSRRKNGFGILGMKCDGIENKKITNTHITFFGLDAFSQLGSKAPS